MRHQLVIVGCGTYVCGRGGDGWGTIVPALYEYTKRKRTALDLKVVYFSQSGKIEAKEKLDQGILEWSDSVSVSYMSEQEALGGGITEASFGIICVPDDMHAKWCDLFVKSYLPFLVVKPFTLRYREAKRIANNARDYGVVGFVEFHKRLDRQLRFARDTVKEGRIGQVQYSYTEYTQPKYIPESTFGSWSERSNIFSYLGVHYVDAFYYVTGAVPIRVMAIGQKSYLVRKGISTWDSIQVVIEWMMKSSSKATQTILCNWIESEKASAVSKQDMNIVGTHGRVTCEMKERGLRLLSDKMYTRDINPDFSREYRRGDGEIEFLGYGIDSVVEAVDAGINGTTEYECLLCNLDDACISTSVIEAAQESLERSSEWVDIVLS